MTPLLQAVNLTKRFGGLTAVDSVSLDVNVGEVIGLVGDNGAGKSTFIKMIAGVYPPDDGELFFEGSTVSFNGPRAAERRSLVGSKMKEEQFLRGKVFSSLHCFTALPSGQSLKTHRRT